MTARAALRLLLSLGAIGAAVYGLTDGVNDEAPWIWSCQAWVVADILREARR